MCTLGTMNSSAVLKTSRMQYPATVNNSEMYSLLSKPCPWMWHLMSGNRVRNGSDRKHETGKALSLKLALLKKSYRRCAVILPRGRARIHWICHAVFIICVILDSTVLCVVLHTVDRNCFKVQLLVNAFGVFRAFYRAISHMISLHKVLH